LVGWALLGLIEDYRQGRATSTAVHHHEIAAEAASRPVGRLLPWLTDSARPLNRYPVPEWVHQQVYLHPYPKELMLRNHV
jgi:uncharacterized protein YbgA (DUF1722 family)